MKYFSLASTPTPAVTANRPTWSCKPVVWPLASLKGATKSDKQRLGLATPSRKGFSVCWRKPYQVRARCVRLSSVHNTMSSPTLLAGYKPTTAWACNQRPSIRRFNMRLPSLKTRCASVPTTSSFKMAGKGPAKSQVWKNGPQSMKGSNSARSKFLNTRLPMNFGAVG